eukprot:scaffold1778_cov246-Pinguiococcus_pyrenoidosus.AAC.22
MCRGQLRDLLVLACILACGQSTAHEPCAIRSQHILNRLQGWVGYRARHGGVGRGGRSSRGRVDVVGLHRWEEQHLLDVGRVRQKHG